MPRVIIWQVTGMHCKSCEKLIADVLQDVSGVIETEVSLKQGRVAVRLRDDAHEPDLDLLNRQLSAHGYVLYPLGCRLPSSGEPFFNRLRRALIALVVVGLVGVFLWSPIHSYLPSVTAGASFGALFVLGLVASISSCLATTGGFMLAYSAETASRRKTVLMHLGRLTAFMLGGLVLGALGGALPAASPGWYAVLALILGIGFLAVALNLMDLTPSLAKLGLALPSSLHKFADKIKKRPGGVTPFLVGAVTFVLPCGFTQTAQALALASGSALNGFLLLTAFALGTLPVLVGVTSFATKVSLKQGMLRVIIGAAMFFFAIGQIQSGMSLFGVSLAVPSADTSGSSSTVVSSDAKEQVVSMKVTSYGYEPSNLTVKKGVPVRWEVDGTQAGGCTGSIVSRELGISKNLDSGINTFTFTPSRTGQIAFSCGMGMVRGSFNVID
ncbi:sulfite exporter TauE/SafE family protein [Candidatus Uhrbacteria bacterium]|nr:sulfite exporter TauE/SafE family protein [Candidatus Uhrbacteria bacterium]